MASGSIKARTNSNPQSECLSCGNSCGDVLGMFDLKVGSTTITVCDQCIEQLLDKCLKAKCSVNSRTKGLHDMSIIRKRQQQACEDRQWQRLEAGATVASMEPAKVRTAGKRKEVKRYGKKGKGRKGI